MFRRIFFSSRKYESAAPRMLDLMPTILSTLGVAVPPGSDAFRTTTPSIEGVQQYMRAEREKWGALVQSLGLTGSQ